MSHETDDPGIFLLGERVALRPLTPLDAAVLTPWMNDDVVTYFMFTGQRPTTVEQVVEEVRRQFREIPGLLAGKARPDYSRSVDIVTKAAQRELLGPATISIGVPILVGFGLGAAALGAYLAGAILTAQLLAVFMANTGGAWDNAKKKIEDGYLGGKGTDAHKAAVIGDTVGDPLKDTAGPALNPLIKVMNLVAILIAPIVIRPLAPGVRFGVVFVALALVAFAVIVSRRSTIIRDDGTVPPGPRGKGEKVESVRA